MLFRSADLKSKADEAFEWFKREMLTDFFKTSLTPPAFLAAAAGQGLLAQLTTLFGPLSTGEVVTTAQQQPALGAPAATGQAADAPTTPRDNVQTTSQINQSASQGPPQVESQSLFSLKELHQDELKRRELDYSMSQAVAWTFGAQGQFTTIARGLDVRRVTREVDLDDEFFRRILVDISLAGDLAATGVSALTVVLEYPLEPSAEAPLTAAAYVFRPGETEEERFTCSLAPDKNLNYRYRTEVVFAADSPWKGTITTLKSGWQISRATRLVLDPLDGLGLLEIQVGPGNLSAELVEQVRVDLRYEDPENNVALGESFVVKPGEAAHAWKIRLADTTRRSVTRTLTYSLVGGGTLQLHPVVSDQDTILVDNPFRGKLRVRLIPQLDPNTLVEAIVVLKYAEPDGSHARQIEKVFNPTAMASEWVEIPTIGETPGPYTWETTLVKTTGDVVNASGTGTAAALLVGEGAGVGKNLEVRLANTDLDGAGLIAVRVRLTGPGSAPDHEELLFTPSQTTPRRVSLLQPPGTTFTYHWEVVGWDRDGHELPPLTGTGDALTLLLALPHP